MIIPSVDQPNTHYASSEGPISIPLQKAAGTPPDVGGVGPAPMEAHLARLQRQRAVGECVGDVGENGYFRRADAALIRAGLSRAIVVVEAG